MKQKKPLGLFGCILAATIFLSGTNASASILPLPDAIIDGVPVSVRYDDYVSYSVALLQEFIDRGHLDESFGPYNFATGTGGIDLLIYTGAKGQTNQNIGPNGDLDFEDPVINSGGNTSEFDGWWGQDDHANDGTADSANGPVTVGQVLDYLHAIHPSINVPAFFFDQNQQGGDPALYISGQVTIWDAINDTEVKHWSMDTEEYFLPEFGAPDGDLNMDYPVLSSGNISAPSLATPGDPYDVDTNRGSGKADFVGYVPSMNLSNYDREYLFVVDFHFGNKFYYGDTIGKYGDLNNGPEEIFIGGLSREFNIPDPVPEPATMLLLGTGLIGVAGAARRRKKNQA